jgi:TolB-like protein/DNA-binding winged helix-turn-helix (wHTH) protein/tetratricopeptide (TPR) repeat protein
MDAEISPKVGSSPAAMASGYRCEISAFDRFQLDSRRGTLRSAEGEIALRPKTYALLCYLLANAGRLVSKDELLQQVWAGTVVTEDSVVQCVGELRTALGSRGPVLVKTVSRRGYLLDVVVSSCVPAPELDSIDTVVKSAVNTRSGRVQKRLAAALLIALTLVGGGIAWWLQQGRPNIDKAIAATRVIAILPFKDLSEPASPAFAEAVVEDLTIAVAQLSETLVISTGSTVGFGDAKVDASGAAKAMGATHVLTGSVQRDGESVVVRAQLRNVAESTVLWSERFDYTGATHWDWQRDITQRVANALDTRLRDAHFPHAAHASYANGAIEATQKGDYLLRHAKVREDLHHARRLFETALATDPNSVVALNGLALTHIAEVSQRWSTERKTQIEAASMLLERSLLLKPDYAMTHYGRSQILYMRGLIDEAAQACEQALALWPNHVYALQRLGFYRLQQGRPTELIEPIRMAMRLNPLDNHSVSQGHFFLGMAQFHLRRDEEAYAEMRKSAAANPNNGFSWQWMAVLDALHGRDEPARLNLGSFQKLIPNQTVSGLRATESSKSPAFWAERERFYEGLSKAGLAP